MEQAQRKSQIAVILVVVIGAAVAIAGSQGSGEVVGLPVFAVVVALAYLINWVVFVPSFQAQTEKYFDLTGSLTYVTVATAALALSSDVDERALLVWGLVVVWALRLGSFLFMRIQKAGKDDRFDNLKPSFWRFLSVWTIQGLWVTFTAAAALVVITTEERQALDIFAVLGFVVWGLGFGFEVIADRQKSQFRAKPENEGKFIQSGLWSLSRHPNYFGEIVLWVGVAIIALPVLQGGQWVAIISPFFVAFLLTRVSGVPMLEKKADKKWGGQDDYEAYKASTPVLIPRIWG